MISFDSPTTEYFIYVALEIKFFQVIMTELKNPQNSIVVCTEQAPILKLCFTADQQAVWVSVIYI